MDSGLDSINWESVQRCIKSSQINEGELVCMLILGGESYNSINRENTNTCALWAVVAEAK